MIEEEQKFLNKMLWKAIEEEKPIEKIEALIKKGADVNAKDSIGLTALMWAKTAEQTKLLIEAGADVNARTYYGDDTALEFAETAEQTALLKAAMQKEAEKKAVGKRIQIEKHKARVKKSRKIRKEIEKREEKVSGVTLADEIAKDVISGKEKRTITPEIRAEIRRRKALEK